MENQIDKINQIIQSSKWYDFEVVEYADYKLVLNGSLDFSSGHQLEIILEKVLFFSISMTWSCDTNKKVFKISKDDNGVPNGYFKILIETDMNITHHIIAQSLSYNDMHVIY